MKSELFCYPTEPCKRKKETCSCKAVPYLMLYCSQRPQGVLRQVNQDTKREVCKPRLNSISGSIKVMWLFITDYHALSRIKFILPLLF